MTGYYTTTDNGTSSATDNTWTIWASATSSSTATTNAVWVAWTGSAANVQSEPVRMTPEQALEAFRLAAEQQAELQRITDEARQKKLAADQRAKELLDAFLTPAQQKTMMEIGSFVVEAQNKKQFRIRKAQTSNIDELNEAGEVVNKFCIVPQESIPLNDQLLAQKLMLETDFASFMRIANRFPQGARQ